MTAKIRKEALRQMEADLAAKQDGPFVREGEKTFQRYDEIRVIQRRPGVVDVEFSWRGKLTSTMHVDFDLSARNELTLAGDGRMELRVL